MLLAVSGAQVMFRVTYARYSELRDDITQQMTRGGLLIKVSDGSGLTFDTEVLLELVLPDGATLRTSTTVLQVLAGFGIAVSVPPALIDQVRRAASSAGHKDTPSAGQARHERVDPAATPATPRACLAPSAPPATITPPATSSSPAIPTPPATSSPTTSTPPATSTHPRGDGPTRAEKIQKALHGTRDERNAILRDRDRTLHPFLLKNPQLDADDVITIAKNAQVAPDLLKLIGERKDWFQRPAIALALARNPKTPPDLAVRALDHVPLDALRQIAKGLGTLPHVTQAARKKLLS
jgi:hypothetical protein